MHANKFNSTEKRWLWGLSFIAFASHAALAFRSNALITLRPYGDDAFYVFSIARNLAFGRGASVDGIHLTNGFQPLIAFIYAPIFWLCSPNDWLAIRWTLVLSGLISAVSVWLLAVLVRSLIREVRELPYHLTAPVISAIFWACSISLFNQTTTGLETGLYSLLLLAVILVWVSGFGTALQVPSPAPDFPPLSSRGGSQVPGTAPVTRSRNPIPYTRTIRNCLFGLLLGITVLTRIDAAILVAILAAAIVLRHGEKWKDAITISGIALLVSLPWWIFNVAHFGSLMPISGQAENSWPMSDYENIKRLIETLTDIMLLFIYTPNSASLFGRIVIAIVVGLVWYGLLWKTNLQRRLRAQSHILLLLPFGVFSLVLVIYYTFFLKAPHFIIRYLQPLRILWIVFAAVSAPLVWNARCGRRPRRPTSDYYTDKDHQSGARDGTRHAILAAIILCSLGFSADRYLRYYTTSEISEFYDMGLWAAQHPAEKIGMLQSGIASFIASTTMRASQEMGIPPNVVNLDGKVNADALRAHQQGRLPAYIRNEHFTYIADQKAMIEDVAALCREDHLYFDSVGMIGDPRLTNDIQLMKRRLSEP